MTTAAAIVVAGGVGSRFGRRGGKQLALVAGEPLFAHALRVLDRCGVFAAIVLVANPEQLAEQTAALEALGLSTPCAAVAGGATRIGSVRCGLAALPVTVETVVVHDGARPLLGAATVSATLAELASHPEAQGVIAALPAFDTVKRVDASGRIVRTEDRAALWLAQTPQTFRAAALRAAYELAERDGFTGTDDASVVEHAGGTVRVVPGARDNIKVTVPGDLELVAALLAAGKERA